MLSRLLFSGRTAAEEGFRFGGSAGRRHVSEHAPHRVRRAIRAALTIAVCGLLCAAPAHAEETKSGTAVQLNRETDVRKEPSDTAQSYGILPEGTVLTLKGQRSGEFLSIKVELENGAIEGWIHRDTISRDAFDGEEVQPRKKKRARDEDEDRPARRPRTKLRIPKDEGLLLRRESSFFYGLQLSPMFVMMTDTSGIRYLGPGGEVGGHFGLFLAQNLKVHLELGYFLANGTSQDPSGSGSGVATTSGTTTDTVTLGFLDVGAAVTYEIDPIEIFAKVKYSFGLSLSDLPTSVTVTNAADLSSLWIQGGVGYRIPLSEVMDVSLRAHWGLSLLKSPLSITGGGLSVFWSIKG